MLCLRLFPFPETDTTKHRHTSFCGRVSAGSLQLYRMLCSLCLVSGCRLVTAPGFSALARLSEALSLSVVSGQCVLKIGLFQPRHRGAAVASVLVKERGTIGSRRHLLWLVAAGKTKTLAQWQRLRRRSLTSAPAQFQLSSSKDDEIPLLTSSQKERQTVQWRPDIDPSDALPASSLKGWLKANQTWNQVQTEP